jgi:hypothetical protein
MSDILKMIGKALSASRQASREVNQSVSELRLHIQDIKRERVRVINLPVSKEETLDRIDRMFDHLSKNVKHFYPEPKELSRPGFNDITVDITSILVAQMVPFMTKKMKEEAEAFYASASGLSDEERKHQLRELDRKLLDAELAEESLIRSAENSGFAIIRRRDSDPRAVLAHDKVLP